MKARLLSRRGPIVVLLCGVIIGATLVGTSIAVTSKKFNYSQTQKGVYSLGAMAFSIDGSTAGAWLNSWGGSSITNDNSSRCFNAGVHLPKGAKIKKVTWIYSSGAGEDFFGSFFRQNPLVGGTSLASVNPADDTGVRTAVSDTVGATQQTVNNKKFGYGVGACVSGTTDFHGARVHYTYKNAGD